MKFPMPTRPKTRRHWLRLLMAINPLAAPAIAQRVAEPTPSASSTRVPNTRPAVQC